MVRSTLAIGKAVSEVGFYILNYSNDSLHDLENIDQVISLFPCFLISNICMDNLTLNGTFTEVLIIPSWLIVVV